MLAWAKRQRLRWHERWKIWSAARRMGMGVSAYRERMRTRCADCCPPKPQCHTCEADDARLNERMKKEGLPLW